MRNSNINTLSNETSWILNSINDGIIITNKEGIVIFVNEAYLKLTGLKKNDIVGQFLKDVRPGAYLPGILDAEIKTINVHQLVKGFSSYLDLVPLFNNKNKLVGGLVVVKDYKEIEKIVQEIKYMRNRQTKFSKNVDIYRAKHSFDDMIINGIEDILKKAKKASYSDVSILLNGETGVGKGMLAEAIHNNSKRKDKPFIAINSTSIPEELLESELFGYEEGAFTGAKKTGKSGLFEIAEGGTIFLDEIGDLSFKLQSKILKFVEDKKIRRWGSTREHEANVRFIVATNKNLWNEVKKGDFREDLYYRLAVFNITIHPLRERKETILVLAKKFIREKEKELKHSIHVSKNVWKILKDYKFTGNIRELFNCMEYMASVMSNYRINEFCLPKYILYNNESNKDILQLDQQLISKQNLDNIIKNIEKEIISKYLAKYGSSLRSKKKIANILSISLATLYNKISKFQQ